MIVLILVKLTAIIYFLLGVMFILCSIIKFTNHLLILLVSLEILRLWTFYSFFGSIFSMSDMCIFLRFLVVSARERVLGLVLFVFYRRLFGKDYILNLRVLKF